MGEIREGLLSIRDRELASENADPPFGTIVANGLRVARSSNYVWWVKMAIYSVLLLVCQSAGTLLVRFYFIGGGRSKWMGTLLQTVGFPILVPFYCYFLLKPSNTSATGATMVNERSPSIRLRAAMYIFVGVLLASSTIMSSVGLKNLSASTFALINATTLAFTAFFAFFMNSQKFTPPIINSVLLLLISSVLLMPQSSSGPSSGAKFVLGFVCTLGFAALTGFINNVLQLSFRKILKGRPMKVMLELIICQLGVASCIILVCLFASGEWKGLKEEMDDFELGKVSYVMVLVWAAIVWQLASLGGIGLIFEVSSLFSNVMGVLCIPIVPTLAIFTFHERMDIDKLISMILAIWGCTSYVYQHYLDDKSSRMAQEKDESTAPAQNDYEDHFSTG